MPPTPRPAVHVAVVLGLVVVVSLFLGPRLYVDRTLLVGDGSYYADPAFRAAVPPDTYTTRPRNFLAHVDNALNGYPRLHFAQTTWSAGEVPWWNPYLATGVPAAGTSSAVFEPVTLVLGRVISVPMVLNLKAVLGLVIAGYGMFLFIIALGVSRPAAVFAAVAFAFSGWTLAWLGRTNIMAEIWMPWMFWAAERLLRGASVGSLGALALFTGFACLSSHPQTALHVLALLGAYSVVRACWLPATLGTRARIFATIVAAVAIGVAIAAVQLVPMAEMLARAEIAGGGRSMARAATDPLQAAWFSLTGDWTMIRRDLPTAVMMIAPLFFGTAADGSFWWRGYNMMEMMVYAGLVPLFFAAYAARCWRHTPAARVWLVLAAVALAAAYALPLANVVNYLPVIRLANNGRLRLAFRFALIVAAAIGLERFVADRSERWPGTSRFVAAFIAAVVVVPAAAYPAIAQWGPARPPGVIVTLWREAGVAVIVAVLAVLTALAARRVASPGVLVAGAIALAVLDPWWHLGDFNPAIPTAHVFPELPVVRFLESDPSLFRVSSGAAASVLPADTKLPYRLYDVDLFDVLSQRRHTRLQQAVNGRRFGQYETLRAFLFRDPAGQRGLLSLMNVKYVLAPPVSWTPNDPYADAPGFRRVYDRDVTVYENLDVLPRAFLVDRVRVLSEDAALAALVARDFDPRAAVILEDPAAPMPPPSPDGDAGSAAVTSLTANRVVVRATTARPAYLVLSEAYYPGWRARVDGADAPIYQADYLFRAVYLTPGEHEIVFAFMPASYVASALATAAGLACVTSCFIVAAWRRGREPAA